MYEKGTILKFVSHNLCGHFSPRKFSQQICLGQEQTPRAIAGKNKLFGKNLDYFPENEKS
jgi:hypothetical protein